ncbi:MAG: hypothetical protein KAT76_07610 [Bacteroidales bacterium]|nr:hypothetical protein [Bacteroidales bacterium]
MTILLTNIKIVIALLAIIFIAAGDAYVETRQIKVQGDFIRSDELGNVFLVKDNQLIKYSSSGEVLHTYSNLYSGEISFVDTHDPFKILVYYEAFGQVEFLDRSLSLTSSSISLSMLNLSLATLVCSSYQGAFWVYDPTNFELQRVTQTLEISERSGNLQQVTGYTPDPNYMLERDNYLYLNDPAVGILIFDKYGSYYKTIPVKGLTSFQVFDRKIIYVENNEISIYDTRLNELSTTSLPREESRSVSVCLSLDPQRLYMLGEDKLFFYEIH